MKGITIIDSIGEKLKKSKYCINEKHKTLTCAFEGVTIAAPDLCNWTITIAPQTTLIVRDENVIHATCFNKIICESNNVIHSTYENAIICVDGNTIMTGSRSVIDCTDGNEISSNCECAIRCRSKNTIKCTSRCSISGIFDNEIVCDDGNSIKCLGNTSVWCGDYCNVIENEIAGIPNKRMHFGNACSIHLNSSDEFQQVNNFKKKCFTSYNDMTTFKIKSKLLKGKK